MYRNTPQSQAFRGSLPRIRESRLLRHRPPKGWCRHSLRRRYGNRSEVPRRFENLVYIFLGFQPERIERDIVNLVVFIDDENYLVIACRPRAVYHIILLFEERADLTSVVAVIAQVAHAVGGLLLRLFLRELTCLLLLVILVAQTTRNAPSRSLSS